MKPNFQKKKNAHKAGKGSPPQRVAIKEGNQKPAEDSLLMLTDQIKKGAPCIIIVDSLDNSGVRFTINKLNLYTSIGLMETHLRSLYKAIPSVEIAVDDGIQKKGSN